MQRLSRYRHVADWLLKHFTEDKLRNLA